MTWGSGLYVTWPWRNSDSIEEEPLEAITPSGLTREEVEKEELKILEACMFGIRSDEKKPLKEG